ncbi:hypothetical protein BLOT_008824 [Blomia tropicalis]|nr:hypothetical protein BLOT_008824 [Blomia tropicalis]
MIVDLWITDKNDKHAIFLLHLSNKIYLSMTSGLFLTFIFSFSRCFCSQRKAQSRLSKCLAVKISHWILNFEHIK